MGDVPATAGRLGVMSLIEDGATCSGRPDELALTIISHGLKCVEDGMCTKASNDYPVVRTHKYEVAPTVDGVPAWKYVDLVCHGVALRVRSCWKASWAVS